MTRRKSSAPLIKLSHNLRCYILAIVCIFVLVSYLSMSDSSFYHLRGNGPIPRSFPEALVDDKFNHAIIVAGHAVMHVEDMGEAQTHDEAWNLLGYQRGQGFPQIISSHIAAGVAAASQDPKSILLFSGGQTRKDAGPTSEAVSYYYLAQQEKLLTDSIHVALEEYARDSFENVLFSLCRFHEVSGNYPSFITVVGFDFKGPRFRNIIREAVRFPVDHFEYIGVKPEVSGFDYAKAVKGEAVVYEMAQRDMYGCGSPSLLDKKMTRDPFHRTVPYELACPDLKSLMHWCGPDQFPGPLPWG